MDTLAQHRASAKQIETAINTLRDGGVVAIPTDTLYGLAACAFDETAVAKVFELKGRPAGMALPLLLADAEDAHRCAVDLPPAFDRLAARFWPGALTLIARKSDAVPYAVTAGMDTVGLRVPDHPLARSVARLLGAPITGTSANRSGMPGLTTAQAVRDEFGDAIGFVLDGGDAPGGVASTVLDLSGDTPRILRQGAIGRDAIEAACGLRVEV